MSLRNLTKERRDEIIKEQKEKHDKLDALEKKSPEDLYEDDLLNFENEYKKTIEKERVDEMSEVAHPTTKKAAGDKARKRTTAKPQRAETRPAPHGQRITPVIDPALVKKVNEEILKRSKEEKVIEDKKTIIEFLVKEGVTGEEITSIMQMRCKEKKKLGGTTEKKLVETKEKKLNGTMDENDANSDTSMMSVNGNDNSGIVKAEISPKRNAQRTAKEKVTKYGVDDEEEDESIIRGMASEDDDNESDYMGSDSETEKKIKKASTKPKQPRKPKSASSNNGTSPTKKKTTTKKPAAGSDNEKSKDESSATTNKNEKPKKPRAKKEPVTTPKKETVKKEPKKPTKRAKKDDSDEEDFSMSSNAPTPKKPRVQRGVAAKKTYRFSDDDDNDNDDDYM